MTNAKAAEGVAKKEYIPEVTGFVRYNYQNGVPFVVHSIGTVGVHFSYDLFDAGKRRALVCERRDKVSEAEEALERVKDEVSVRMTTIYNKLETTKATAGLLLGDIATAKKDVVRAWMVAKIADPAARVRYATCMATGFGTTLMQGGAGPLNEAFKVAGTHLRRRSFRSRCHPSTRSEPCRTASDNPQSATARD